MYYTDGNYQMGGNFRIKKQGPIDDRMIVDTLSKLGDPDLFDGYIYNGMLVTVVSDEPNNGVYRLVDKETMTWSVVGEGLNGLPDYDKTDDIGKYLMIGEDGEPNWFSSPIIPDYDSNDNGKLLTVDENSELKWIDGADSITYTNTNSVPVTVGGISSGTKFSNKSVTDVLDMLLYPYQSPVFSQFLINIPNVLEVGNTLPANTYNVTWAITNSSNVIDESIAISDTTNSIVLQSDMSNTGSTTISLSAITKISDTSHTWSISATNSKNQVFSRSFSTKWMYKVYAGESDLPLLDNSNIRALRLSTLSDSFGVKQDYYVHRSKNILNGSINIRIS